MCDDVEICRRHTCPSERRHWVWLCGDTHVSAMRTRTMHMGVTTCVLKSVKREISARYEDVVL